MFRLPVVLLVALALVPVTAFGLEHYCTLEAETWGSFRASFNDVPVPDLVNACVTEFAPIVVGLPGRSVILAEGSEPVVVDELPANGKAGPLPPDIGDLLIGSGVPVLAGRPVGGGSRLWKNPLLGQTVALSLNMRLDPGLAFAPVDATIRTVAALPGDDGLYGTDDDVMCPDCDTLSVSIPEAVLSAVEQGTGLPPTVGGVLDLANAVLGGGESYGAGPRDVMRAIGNLNRAFEESRFLVSAPPETIIIPVLLASRAPGGSYRLSLSAAGRAGSCPTLALALAEESLVRLVAYSASGREVAAVERVLPAGETTIEFPTDRGLPSGVYFVKAIASGLRTGETAVATTTSVLLR